MSTTIIKSRSRGRFVVRGGRYISVNLDSRTLIQGTNASVDPTNSDWLCHNCAVDRLGTKLASAASG